MTRIKLYMDEDSMDQELVRALRARGVDVRTALDAKMVDRSDEDQLRWASTHSRVLYSFNVGHFFRLHSAFLARGEDHGGLVLVPQQRYSVGDQLRGLLRLVSTRSTEDMRQRAEFLSTWIAAPPTG